MNPPETDERLGLPSASGIQRLVECPGSWNASRGLSSESNKDSERGDRLHAAWETQDGSELEMPEKDFMALVHKDERRLLEVWAKRFDLEKEEVVIVREKRFWIHDDTNTPVCSCKVDFIAVAPGHALILDLKSGWKKVAVPARNWQLRTGAIAAWSELPRIRNVRVAIVQPFCEAEPPCDYDSIDLLTSEGELFDILKRVKDPNAPRIAGDHCTYCPAKHVCPEAHAPVQALQVNPVGKWAVMSPAEKLKLWDACQLADKVIKAIEKQIKSDLAANPEAIPGLVKKPDTSVREIKDSAELYGALLDAFPDQAELVGQKFRDIVKVSVGDCTSLYRELKGCTADDADLWINPLVTKKPRAGKVERVKG